MANEKMQACQDALLDVDDTFFDIGNAPIHRIVDIGSKFAKMTNILDRIFAFNLKQYLKYHKPKGARTEEQKEEDKENEQRIEDDIIRIAVLEQEIRDLPDLNHYERNQMYCIRVARQFPDLADRMTVLYNRPDIVHHCIRPCENKYDRQYWNANVHRVNAKWQPG
jgi:hypothetical protein